MSAFAKTESLMRNLEANLKLRLPATYIFTRSADANGYPVLSIAQDSSWATQEFKAVLRLLPLDTPFNNSIGQAQPVYTPCKVQLCTETATGLAGVSALSAANAAQVAAEVNRLSVRQEHFMTAAATEPVLASLVAGNLVATIDPDLKWSLAGQ